MPDLCTTIRAVILTLFAVPLGCGPKSGSDTARDLEPAVAWEVSRVDVFQEQGARCDPTAGLASALATGDCRFPQHARPAVRVAIGCERKQSCVLIHAAVSLKVSSTLEPDALFEGAAIREAGCGAWPFSEVARVVGIGRTIQDALAMACGQYRLLHASDEEVLRAIEAAQPRGILLSAMDVAGDRRLREAVPMLIRLLSSEDSDVVMRAIGALGRIRDPLAVRPLGRVALAPVPLAPHAALQAIADIGGPEAVRVLEFVAEQTTSPVIAEEARDLLEQVRRASGGL